MNDDKDFETREFRYIDAMPGAGKTEYFVNQAVTLLQRQDANYILVYVAPTADLLHETYQRVRAKLDDKSVMSRVQVVAEPNRVAEAFLGTKYKVIGDQPTTALNYLFGLITRERYLDTKYRAGRKHDLESEAQLGQIIMTTHESFVRVNRFDTTERDYQLLKRMVVIFDEARKCVMQPRDFKIPRDQWMKLWRSITVDAVESESPAWRKRFKLDPIPLEKGDRPQNLYVIRSVAPLEKIKEQFGVSTRSLLPEDVRDLLSMYKEYSGSGRGSIFILSNLEISELYDANPGGEKISVQVVMRPTALFNNYKHVILTSAFFTDSQMYHFLKRDGHTLVPLLEGQQLSPALKNIKARSERLRRAATRRLHVATLLRSEYFGSKQVFWENLSSYLLTKGMVVPVKLATEVAGELDLDRSHDELISELANPEGKSVCKSTELEAQLKRFAVPPLWPLLSAAARIFETWVQTHYPNSGNRSLLALNANDKRVWYPNGTRYLRTVKFTIAHGSLTRKPGRSGSTVYDRKHRRDAILVPPHWDKRLRTVLYDRLDSSTFTVPDTPTLHGINLYSSMIAFTHLAALNPNPTQTRFYKLLIPDYDIDQDHSIENLVQTLYRTNLRDPGAKGPVLMIVPYVASAILLARKIGVEGFKLVNEPPLTVLHHFKVMSEASKVKQRQRTQEVNRKYSRTFDADLTAARRRLSAARSAFKKAPDSQKRRENVARWEKELKELQARAALKKDKK